MSLEGGIERKEEEVLNEAQTLEFLREHKLELVRNWKPGDPVLYVFPNYLREDGKDLSKDGEGKLLPWNKRPTIARLEAPKSIKFDKLERSASGFQVHMLVNNSKVDYFVINAKTKMPEIVRTTTRKEAHSYLVRPDTLFMPSDELFPPSSHEE
jgi:hypothetical protein